jgi:hypothetical protein
MSNLPQGAEHDINAPYNELKIEKYYRDVEVIFFLERTETVRVECNIDTDEILQEAKEAIDNVGTYLAKSLNLEYVDYDFENRNDKFEK